MVALVGMKNCRAKIGQTRSTPPYEGRFIVHRVFWGVNILVFYSIFFEASVWGSYID